MKLREQEVMVGSEPPVGTVYREANASRKVVG